MPMHPTADPRGESPEPIGLRVSHSGRRFQAVVATTGFSGSDSSRRMASAGVMNPRVFRGLPLSSTATASRYSGSWTERSVPLGKYWRSRRIAEVDRHVGGERDGLVLGQ